MYIYFRAAHRVSFGILRNREWIHCGL